MKRMEALENEVEELGDRLNSSTKLIATQLDVTQNQIMHLNLHVCTFPAQCTWRGDDSLSVYTQRSRRLSPVLRVWSPVCGV